MNNSLALNIKRIFCAWYTNTSVFGTKVSLLPILIITITKLSVKIYSLQLQMNKTHYKILKYLSTI